MTPERRHVAAVVGDARTIGPGLETAEALGQAIVNAGLRLVTGGLSGIMEAASRGARRAKAHRPGDVIGILPSYAFADANEYVEIVVCTGMGHARNVMVVASADVVFAIGGKSGTLSEIALAWTLSKPVIAVGTAPGWSQRVAGAPLDARRSDPVHGPLEPDDAVRLACELLAHPAPVPREFR